MIVSHSCDWLGSGQVLALMKRLRAALIGDAFVDVQVAGVGVLPSWGADVACSSVRLLPGGSCGNTARQLGMLGQQNLEACFFSCVGDDEAGRHYRHTLEEEGSLSMPSRTLRVLEGTPQSCCVILSGATDRAMCSCYETVHRVATEMFSEMLLAEPWALLHLGGYFNCIGLHDDALLEVLQSLRAHGTTISLDPQHDCSNKWSGEGGHLTRLLPLVDVFLPNETEVCHIAGGTATVEEALKCLCAAYPQLLLVVKIGEKGLRAARGEERWAMPAVPVASFVDSTGAGDASSAGFLVQYLRDPSDVQLALQWGAAAGALCVSKPGACEQPISADEIAVVLERGAVS